jgi:hypothetical protein
MSNPVEQLRNEYKAIESYLLKHTELSYVNDLNKHLRKILILSAGSYFEDKITTILLDFAKTKSNEDVRIVNFLKQQALNQRYHTLFVWGEKDKPEEPGKNANKFFSLFGEEFKKEVDDDIKKRDGLKESIKAFIEIGHLRNILVHSNFAEYVYEQKTSDEIFALFQKAEPFLVYLAEKLK